jgi:hypothetical protein
MPGPCRFERQLATGLGHRDHGGVGPRGTSAPLVPGREPGPHGCTGPTAGPGAAAAFRAPLPHAREVRHQLVDRVRWGRDVDGHRIVTPALGHGRFLSSSRPRPAPARIRRGCCRRRRPVGRVSRPESRSGSVQGSGTGQPVQHLYRPTRRRPRRRPRRTVRRPGMPSTSPTPRVAVSCQRQPERPPGQQPARTAVPCGSRSTSRLPRRGRPSTEPAGSARPVSP